MQKFIESFLFGRKKKKNVEDTVSELDKNIQSSMKDMKDSISKLEGDVCRLTQKQPFDPTIPQLVQELKQDLSSLKALLLSRYVHSTSFYIKDKFNYFLYFLIYAKSQRMRRVDL